MYRRIIFIILYVIVIVYCSIDIKSVDIDKRNSITVEVKGEVKNEALITLPIGSTLNDLLKLVELNEYSDISKISRYEVLKNKQIIVIPKKQEKTYISINSARIEDLTSLPGIGNSIAQEIINYRTIHGSFKSLEELMNVKGIGIRKYEKIKDYICI